MPKDIGEEIVGAWLGIIADCDFVQYNVATQMKQGEIDVIGLNLKNKTAYICEVATHINGIHYVKGGQPDNQRKLVQKFKMNIDYAEKYLKEFSHQYMLWSPVVKLPLRNDTLHSAFRDLANVCKDIEQYRSEIKIELIINELYQDKIDELKEKAGSESNIREYPVYRFLQILANLEKNITYLSKRGITDSQKVIEELKGNNDGL